MGLALRARGASAIQGVAQGLWGVLALGLATIAAPVSAQTTAPGSETAPETGSEPSGETTEAPDVHTVRAESGRGLVYGAHLVVPIALTDVRRAGGGATLPMLNPGAGLLVRLGWELPAGFSIEAQGGFALHVVDHPSCAAMECPRRQLTRIDARLAARYAFLNGSGFTPFVELGAGARILTFDFGDGLDEPSPAASFAAHAGAGIQLEPAPFVAVELGLVVDYLVPIEPLDAPGILGLTPFAGVTLYLYDADD